MDYSIGPKKTSDRAYIHNDNKILDTWDHYPIFASTQKDDARIPLENKTMSEFKKKTVKKSDYWKRRPQGEQRRVLEKQLRKARADQSVKCR